MSSSLPEDPQLRRRSPSRSSRRAGPPRYGTPSGDSRGCPRRSRRSSASTRTTDVGYGKHILEARYSEPWRSSVTDATRAKMLDYQAAVVAHDMSGGADELAAIYRRVTGQTHAAGRGRRDPPPMWTGTIEMTHAEHATDRRALARAPAACRRRQLHRHGLRLRRDAARATARVRHPRERGDVPPHGRTRRPGPAPVGGPVRRPPGERRAVASPVERRLLQARSARSTRRWTR